MRVLGIETATIACAASLSVDGTIVARRHLHQKNVHAETLMGMVADVLEESGRELNDLDVIAVSIGPGSFTGLRIGLSVAKGLAYAREMRIVSVPTLEALANAALPAVPKEEGYFVLPMLDARRDEVYYQLFDVKDGGLQPCQTERGITINDVVEEVCDLKIVVAGDVNKKFVRLFNRRGGTHVSALRTFGNDLESYNADSVALLGARFATIGKFEEVEALEPRYMKDFFTTAR